MLKIEHKLVRLSASEYIEGYCDANRFIGYCKQCNNFGKIWVCPPYKFNTLDRIKNYSYVHIIGSKVFIDDITRHSPQNARQQKEISYQIMEKGRKNLDRQLLELEKQYPGTLAFFAGSCYLCRKEDCTRRIGEKCIHLDKARSSLEAYGFDISKTTSELLEIELIWSQNLVLPEYFTLVSGLFTNYEIDLNYHNF